MNVNDKVKQVIEQYMDEPLKSQKVMVLILPATILAFIGMVGQYLFNYTSIFTDASINSWHDDAKNA